MEWDNYMKAIANLLENYELLTEVAFDLFDCNCD